MNCSLWIFYAEEQEVVGSVFQANGFQRLKVKYSAHVCVCIYAEKTLNSEKWI